MTPNPTADHSPLAAMLDSEGWEQALKIVSHELRRVRKGILSGQVNEHGVSNLNFAKQLFRSIYMPTGFEMPPILQGCFE